jgi:hypothetical protein
MKLAGKAKPFRRVLRQSRLSGMQRRTFAAKSLPREFGVRRLDGALAFVRVADV